MFPSRVAPYQLYLLMRGLRPLGVYIGTSCLLRIKERWIDQMWNPYMAFGHIDTFVPSFLCEHLYLLGHLSLPKLLWSFFPTDSSLHLLKRCERMVGQRWPGFIMRGPAQESKDGPCSVRAVIDVAGLSLCHSRCSVLKRHASFSIFSIFYLEDLGSFIHSIFLSDRSIFTAFL